MKRFWVILMLASFFLSGCGNREKKRLVQQAPFLSQAFEDDAGQTIRLPGKPKSVISIAPNITEIIFALGAQGKLAARSEACDYPDAVSEYPAISVFPQMDIDHVKELNADLILSTTETFSPQDLQRFHALGLPPVYLQEFSQFADLYRGIRLLGNILDKEETANHLADSLQQLYARISDSTENQIKYRTIMLVSMDPLRVVGGMGILNEMIDKSGGMNVMADKKEAFPEVTPEEILKAEPEFLIMPFPNNQAYADLLALYPTLYNTPAEVYKQVRVVDPDLFFRFGPRIFDGFLTLTHILHTRLNPEEFRHQDSEG